MSKCRSCGNDNPKDKNKRSSKIFCSHRCYLLFGLKKEENGCWIRTTSIRKDGYCDMKIEGKSELAHRISYKIYIGEIPEEKLVCHTCDVRNCCNPDHLYLGNDSSNALDRQKRNKSSCQLGSNNRAAKLSEVEVKILKYLLNWGVQGKRLAKFFNVSVSTISSIKLKQNWSHIGE